MLLLIIAQTKCFDRFIESDFKKQANLHKGLSVLENFLGKNLTSSQILSPYIFQL